MEILKFVWRLAPQSFRLLFCKALCGIFASKRLKVTHFSDVEIVCGAFASSSGIGQGARLYADELERDGINAVRVDVTRVMRMLPDLPLADNVWPLAKLKKLTVGKRVIIHANPPQFQFVLCALGRKFLIGKRIIGYWAWELEAFPSIWIQALDYLDEIEAPSSFVADNLRGITNKRVTAHPHKLPKPPRRKSEYAKDGVIRCLNIFDAGSGWERKNPEAALKAFSKAFPPGSAKLTFKISNAEKNNEKLKKFRQESAANPGVEIDARILSSSEMEELYFEHDIYISLHRSEGYGLTIKEALDRGLHVVATGWSGNMDFMDNPHAWPVSYAFVDVNMFAGPYKGISSRWAEADANEAAEILRQIVVEIGQPVKTQANAN